MLSEDTLKNKVQLKIVVNVLVISKQISSVDGQFTLANGKVFVASSREAIENYLRTNKIEIPRALQNNSAYETKLGCFLTLKQDDNERSLRGCVGFPEPIYNLSRSITEAAVYAATRDPRFKPVSRDELQKLLIETSILNKPKLIETKSLSELPTKVNIGQDGLIMRWAYGSGLLLPQVAIEQAWSAEDFLSNLSMKAGAPPDQWLVPGTMIMKFQCLIFGEKSPCGKVELL